MLYVKVCWLFFVGCHAATIINAQQLSLYLIIATSCGIRSNKKFSASADDCVGQTHGL